MGLTRTSKLLRSQALDVLCDLGQESQSTRESQESVESVPELDNGTKSSGSLPHGETVYRTLRSELISGAIKPGTRLFEAEIADRLRVSRTPVREAIRRLESDGFVQTVGRNRRIATPIGIDDLGDIGLLRVEIDALAAKLASARGTVRDWATLRASIENLGNESASPEQLALAHAEVHRIIYNVAFGPRISIFVENHLLPYLELTVNIGAPHTSSKSSLRSHLALLTALSSGDDERAAAQARSHAEDGLRAAKSDQSNSR